MQSNSKAELADGQAATIMGMPVMDSFLPIRFENGAQIKTVSVLCAGCGKTIGATEMRTELKRVDGSAMVEGFGLCYECKTVSPFLFEFRDDGSYRYKDAKGKWVTLKYGSKPFYRDLSKTIPPLIAFIVVMLWVCFANAETLLKYSDCGGFVSAKAGEPASIILPNRFDYQWRVLHAEGGITLKRDLNEVNTVFSWTMPPGNAAISIELVRAHGAVEAIETCTLGLLVEEE